jgi:hypothetical protein
MIHMNSMVTESSTIGVGAIAALIANCCVAKANENWPLGVEREVDEGVYSGLISRVDGWALWKFEFRGGLRCVARKEADGRSSAYPLGVGVQLGGPNSTPAVEIRADVGSRVYVDLIGRHDPQVNTGAEEFRSLGDRYWQEWRDDPYFFIRIDGSTIQIHRETWLYPNLRLHLSDEVANFDLSGITAAARAVKTCVEDAVEGRQKQKTIPPYPFRESSGVSTELKIREIWNNSNTTDLQREAIAYIVADETRSGVPNWERAYKRYVDLYMTQ